jgi:hypothetical protein
MTRLPPKPPIPPPPPIKVTERRDYGTPKIGGRDFERDRPRLPANPPLPPPPKPPPTKKP